jgi:hypothetical protein
MKKAAFFSILFFVFVSVRSQSVAGTWIYNNGNVPVTMFLSTDGTGEFQGQPVKYKIQDGKMLFDDGIQPVTCNYVLKQNSLTLSGGGMQLAITFTRAGSTPENTAGVNQQSATTPQTQSSNQGAVKPDIPVAAMAGNSSGQSGNQSLSGVWEGQQGKLVFYPDGNLLYNNTSYLFSVSGGQLIIKANDGSTAFNFSQTGNTITISQNGSSATYSRTSEIKQDKVDPQLAGKWCIVSSSYNSYSGGGSSSEECITLNADGTYEYFYSASRSAYAANQSVYGGTANQNSDRGTWKSDGLTIWSSSQTTGKVTRYSLGKGNAENGDPMIIIGGKRFVTAYNRPRW